MTPSEYLHSTGVKCPTKPPAFPHNWCSSTVAAILDRQEYTGDTVNFRSFSRSFKQKKRLKRPQEEWKMFPNTHPSIIDRETFALVQNLRQHRRRPTKPALSVCFPGCSIVPTAAASWGTAPPTTTSGSRHFLLFRLPQQYPCLFRPFHPGECSRGTGAGGPATAAVVHPGL